MTFTHADAIESIPLVYAQIYILVEVENLCET